MTNSSILGGTLPPRRPEGKAVDLLGPSDSSDSGSDVQGERPMPTAPDNPGEWGAVVAETDSDTDAAGTGERASSDGTADEEAVDILPDRIIENPGSDDDPAKRRRSIEAGELSADDAEPDDPAGEEPPETAP